MRCSLSTLDWMYSTLARNKAVSYTHLDVYKRQVQTQVIDFSITNQVTIPLNGLQNGVYFVELVKDGVSIQRILVKQ